MHQEGSDSLNGDSNLRAGPATRSPAAHLVSYRGPRRRLASALFALDAREFVTGLSVSAFCLLVGIEVMSAAQSRSCPRSRRGAVIQLLAAAEPKTEAGDLR